MRANPHVLRTSIVRDGDLVLDTTSTFLRGFIRIVGIIVHQEVFEVPIRCVLIDLSVGEVVHV